DLPRAKGSDQPAESGQYTLCAEYPRAGWPSAHLGIVEVIDVEPPCYHREECIGDFNLKTVLRRRREGETPQNESEIAGNPAHGHDPDVVCAVCPRVGTVSGEPRSLIDQMPAHQVGDRDRRGIWYERRCGVDKRLEYGLREYRGHLPQTELPQP